MSDNLCSVCDRPHPYVGQDHRYTTPCQWPLGCATEAHRGVEGVTPLNQTERHFYCEAHLHDIISGRAYRRTVDQATRLGLRTDIADPEIVAATEALGAHQAVCADCAAVRRWTLTEIAAGRVQTIEDRNAVGRYTIEHACEDGQHLYQAVGRAMLK